MVSVGIIETVPSIEIVGFSPAAQHAMYQTGSKLRLRLIDLESSGFECALIVKCREDVARQILLVRYVGAGETVAMIVQDEGSREIESTKVASICVEDPADVFDFVLALFDSRPDSPTEISLGGRVGIVIGHFVAICGELLNGYVPELVALVVEAHSPHAYDGGLPALGVAVFLPHGRG